MRFNMEWTKQEFIAYMKEYDFYGDRTFPHHLYKSGCTLSLGIYCHDKGFSCYLTNKEYHEYKYTKANADKLIAVCNIELEKYED